MALGVSQPRRCAASSGPLTWATRPLRGARRVSQGNVWRDGLSELIGPPGPPTLPGEAGNRVVTAASSWRPVGCATRGAANWRPGGDVFARCVSLLIIRRIGRGAVAVS